MTLKSSIRALTDPQTKPASLAPAQEVGARAASQAIGRAQEGTEGSDFVFEESDYTLRQYWPDADIVDPSGFLSFQVKPIKSIEMTSGPAASFKEPV